MATVSGIRNVTSSFGNYLLIGDANANVLLGDALRGQGDPDRIAQGLVLIFPFSQVDQERELIRGRWV